MILALASILAGVPSACIKHTAPLQSVATSAPPVATSQGLDDPARCPRVPASSTGTATPKLAAEGEALVARSKSPAANAAIAAANGRDMLPANAERAVTRDDDPSQLTPVKIQAIVRGQYPSFRRCYESGLARHATLSGKLAMRFSIEADGKVSGVSIQENLVPDCAVVRCLLDEMARVAFPPAAGDRERIVVVYPIMFEPG